MHPKTPPYSSSLANFGSSMSLGLFGKNQTNKFCPPLIRRYLARDKCLNGLWTCPFGEHPCFVWWRNALSALPSLLFHFLFYFYYHFTPIGLLHVLRLCACRRSLLGSYILVANALFWFKGPTNAFLLA